MLTEAERQQIRETGIGKSGDIGGQPKITYWTPDGREIRAMPDMHEYSKKRDGKEIEAGVRDANLDKGWLLQRPSVLKPYCPHCDRWHDTPEDVTRCGVSKANFNARMMQVAQKELKKDPAVDRIDKLENDLSEIKEMLKRLVK